MNHQFPITSRKLLAAIGSGPGTTRWTEFFHKYTPGLRDYATRHFPSLEADDLIQDTFLILVKRLKTYQYDPEAKGAFHNYLAGILRFLAIDRLRDKDRETTSRKRLAEDPTTQPAAEKSFSVDGWKKAAYEIALRRFSPPLHWGLSPRSPSSRPSSANANRRKPKKRNANAGTKTSAAPRKV